MRALLVGVSLVAGSLAASCTDMGDCCECLYEAGELECQAGDTKEECVDRCFGLCDVAVACYCTAARRADCTAECNCNIP